jgi:hypothetical protein
MQNLSPDEHVSLFTTRKMKEFGYEPDPRERDVVRILSMWTVTYKVIEGLSHNKTLTGFLHVVR